MELAPAAAEGRQLLQGYRPGGFTVAGRRWSGSILLVPDRTWPWAAAEVAAITADGLAPLRAAVPTPELVLVGTGARFALLPAALRDELKAWGMVAEPMATPAACRTWNVLVAEGRRVAAALLALP